MDAFNRAAVFQPDRSAPSKRLDVGSSPTGRATASSFNGQDGLFLTCRSRFDPGRGSHLFFSMLPSSSGQGCLVLSQSTRVRISQGVPRPGHLTDRISRYEREHGRFKSSLGYHMARSFNLNRTLPSEGNDGGLIPPWAATSRSSRSWVGPWSFKPRNRVRVSAGVPFCEREPCKGLGYVPGKSLP